MGRDAYAIASAAPKLMPDAQYLEKRRRLGKQRNRRHAHRYSKEKAKAERMLKDSKSPGVDNILAETLKHGGPGIIDTSSVV